MQTKHIFTFVVNQPSNQVDKMGGSQSTEKATDIDSTGQVNNSFVVKGPLDVHNTEIIVMLLILCGLRILEVAYGMYTACKRRVQRAIRENERIRMQRQPNTPRASPRQNGRDNV